MDVSKFDNGSYVMSITPFDERGRIDEEALREHVRWMAREGIRPLPASASSGEGTLLTDAEIFRIWDIFVEEADGRFPVVAANREFPTAAENIRFAKEAEARGLDGIQIYPITLGHVLKPTRGMLDDFYDAVLPHVNLPVLISSNDATGFEVPLDLHAGLIARHANVFGIYKNSSDIMSCATFYAAVAPPAILLTGYLRLPMASLLGGTTVLDYLQNIAPRTCRAMHDAVLSGDLPRAGESYSRLVTILDQTSQLWRREDSMRVPVYKGILRALGRPGSLNARAPFQRLTPQQQGRIEQLVDGLRLRELEGFN